MMPDEIERPKPLPPGDYIVTIKSHTQDVAQTGTKYIEFHTTPVEALPNVDEDWLKEALTKADGSTKKLGDFTLRVRFYDTSEAAFMLKEFLINDVQLDPEDRSIGQMVEAATNAQVIVSVKHASRDGRTFINVTGTAPVEAPAPKKAARR
jgi:hypothetical protein